MKDEELQDLTGLSLHTLTFGYNSPVTDAGMKEIGMIKSLRSLTLWGTKVTDAGLKELKGLKLHTLRLRNGQITDQTLRVLREMDMLHALGNGKRASRPESAASVRWLHLGGTKVTDAGLKELTGLTGLEGINLNDTKVTDVGVAELKKAIPGLKVDRWKSPGRTQSPQPPAKD